MTRIDMKAPRETSGKKRTDTIGVCVKYWFLLVGTRLQPTIPEPSLPQLRWKETDQHAERNGTLTG